MTAICINSNKRVLVVARRFWPTTTDESLRLACWTNRLRLAGAEPTILTSRPNTSWPERIVINETPVVRIQAALSNPRRSGKYYRHLVDWVRKEAPDYDLVYFDDVGLEASVVMSQINARSLPPTVVRFDQTRLSLGGDRLWQPPKTIVDICRSASTVIVPNAISHQTLLSVGITQTPLVRIDDFAHDSLDRNIGNRRRARRILGQVSHDLFTRSLDRLVVCPGELTEHWQIGFLIRAFGKLVQDNRDLRLWILGDGPDRSRLYKSLRHQGLHHLIAMPGVFTDLEQILQAADLCLFPGPGVGLSWLAPTCAANNLPIMVADSPAATQLCGEQSQEIVFSSEDSNDLTGKVARWLRDPSQLSSAALALQKRLAMMADSLNACHRFLSIIDATESTSCA